jgi:hypothetical protein
MNEEKLNEVMQTMSASRILVAILEHLGSVIIPTEKFMSANEVDRNLSVSYNDDTLSFEFSLKED